MKYFIVFLVLASFAVIMPQSFGECISLPCDDINIKLDEPNYRFVDFSYANTFEDSIKFILERTAYGHCISFNAEIIDEDGNPVWGEGSFALCDPITNPSLITSQIKIGYNEDNPIIINESGIYLIKVQIDDGIIQREFVVRQNHTGISLDRTIYPVPWSDMTSPLKQFKEGIALNEIQCRDGLVQVIKKSNNMPACVTYHTGIKLLERGWAICDDEISYGRGHPCGIRSSGINNFNSEKYTEVSIITIPLGAVIEGHGYLSPDEITVVLGKNNTVTWVNEDDTAHEFNSDQGGENFWTTGTIYPNKESTVVFNQTGIFEYHGNPHPWLTGKVIILGEEENEN